MRPDHRGHAVAAPVIAALLLVACGSPAPAGEAQKTAEQIYADARRAIASVRAYHMTLDSTSLSHGHLHWDVTVGAPGRLRAVLAQGGTAADVVYVDGAGYLRGHDFIAATAGPALAARVGDRWLLLQPGPITELLALLADPVRVGHCLSSDHGTLVKGAVTAWRGQRVVEVRDLADVPGDSPGTLQVSAVGTPYPLHAFQTGIATPGQEQVEPGCATGPPARPGDVRSAEVTYSGFNRGVTITAPTDVVDLAPET